MKTTRSLSIAVLTALAIITVLPGAAQADVIWNGSSSSDWATAANWTGGLPSDLLAGNAIINPGSPNATPLVSTAANTTIGQLYLSTGGALQVVTGGSLSVASDLVTGVFGNSGVVDVSGGTLTLGGYLNMGAGGFDGKVNISGGTVTAANLSINTTGGALMNLGGSGTFIAPSSNLGNINYWVTHNAIIANGGASGWSVNVDTLSQPGSVVLTAVPEPSAWAMLVLSSCILVMVLRRRRLQ